MADTPKAPERRTSPAVAAVRYGFGGMMVIAGIVMLIVNPGGFGVDGFALAAGGGLSVLMINFLYRMGVEGDRERDAEEAARRYFDEHGRWPDEAPRPPREPRTARPGARPPQR